MRELSFLAVLVLYPATAGAQIWKDATPLKSTREDVQRIQPNEKRLQNGNSFFEGSEEDVTVTFYRSSCDSLDPRFASNAKNKVLEIRTDLKKKTAVATLLATYIKEFEEIILSPNMKVYIDHKFGYAVIARTAEDYPEMAYSTFHLPASASIPTCLLPELSIEIQDAFKRSEIWKQKTNESDGLEQRLEECRAG